MLTRIADALYRRRDALLASPSFHRRAAAFPLTRWLVRRRTRELFDITAGFVYSQVLVACVRLDLFAKLAGGPKTLPRLAAETALPAAGLEHLLRAAAELCLLSERGRGRWGLGELGAASLGSPGIAAMVAHHEFLYRDLGDPLALIHDRLQASLRDYWAYAGSPGQTDDHSAQRYSELMAASQSFVADDVLAAFSLNRVRHLVDVGGGAGVFAIQALRNHPQLNATVVDLPPVAALARDRLCNEGLHDRGHVLAANMFSDALPGGADLITFVRILHDHDDDAVMQLLRSARRAVAPDGRLLIAEPMAGTRGAGGVGAYFELYLWAMGSGRPRRRSELAAMLEEAGFADVREHRTRRPLLIRALSARPADGARGP